MSIFIRKLFSREREPKTPASGFDSNRSMVDFITDDFDPDSSFRSHQPRLDRTFSGGLDFEENNFSTRINRVSTAESLTDLPIRKPKLTITSALNTPKRGTIMEDMYEILQEQVIEQLGGFLFQTRKEPTLSPKLLKTVQSKDFDLYISRLRKVFDVYKKNMDARIAHKQKEQVNMTASLLKCYEIVPNEYFDERFVFNFNFLVKDKGLIVQVQEDLSEYLDVVEINLYHQVTNKFEEYLDMMLKINSMESQIQNSLYSVRFFRNFNQELRKKFSSRTQDVLRRKRTTLNIEKTLALIDLINIVKKTLPTLVHLIKKNNFESAVKIIRTSEEIYKTKLKQVKALKNFNANFSEARNTLEKLLTSEFEDRCVNYFTPALLYNKPATNAPKDSLVEESFLNVISEGSSDARLTHPLYWTLGKFPVNMNVERDIIKIVVEYIKIKDFPLTVYKGKLLEVMKNFHKKFMADVTELTENQNTKQKQNANVQKTLPFELHLKLIIFYFETFKRFIGEHFELNHRILSTLVEYYNHNFVEKGGAPSTSYPYTQTLDTKAMKDLNETVQEFYLTLAMIFKYFDDRMTEVINIRSFENISIQQFTQLVGVFERIIDYFHNTLQIEERLNSWIVSDKESIKKPLLRLVSSLSDKITISPIQTLMIEIERAFINVYHKRQLETLKSNLEQENWQAVDIPPEYNDYFEIFFRTAPKVQTNKNMVGSDISSTESSSPSYEGGITHEQGSNQEQEHGKKETFFKFEKNEFYLQGKKYQVTSSFLLLIQTLYDYFQIAFKYKFIQLDALSKIFETIKFYNSYTIQLVLGAGATAFGKIPRITAKVLGISSISLCLLVNLIDPLYENLAKQESRIKLEWLNQEVIKVKNDLIGHINEIGAKVRSILKTKLVEQSNELRKINWASAQEKIVAPSKFTTNILTNTKQMYKQIQAFLLKEQLVAIAKGILEDMKNNYLPVFEGINVETRIAAKRVKDELQHFNDELYQVAIFQEPEVNYSDFEDRILSIIEDKCNHFLEITSIN